jgi:hypothetical protein
MVGMISYVVLIFPLGQTGAPTRNPRKSFFPELHPINFPYVWQASLKRQHAAVWGGDHRNRAPPDKSYFEYFIKFFAKTGFFRKKPGFRPV